MGQLAYGPAAMALLLLLACQASGELLQPHVRYCSQITLSRASCGIPRPCTQRSSSDYKRALARN